MQARTPLRTDSAIAYRPSYIGAFRGRGIKTNTVLLLFYHSIQWRVINIGTSSK